MPQIYLFPNKRHGMLSWKTGKYLKYFQNVKKADVIIITHKTHNEENTSEAEVSLENIPNNVFWGRAIFNRVLDEHNILSKDHSVNFQIGKSYNGASQDLMLLIAVSRRVARVPLDAVSINGVLT